MRRARHVLGYSLPRHCHDTAISNFWSVSSVNRPAYETAANRDAEREIVEAWISHRWPGKRTARKFPTGPRYCIDYGLYSGFDNLMAVAEIKDRGAQYATVILGASKMHELIRWMRNGTPAYFVVRIPRGIFEYRITVDVTHLGIKLGGRSDRNDSNDMEPVYHIPMDYFTKVTP